jgi:hypothetical protein
MRLALAVALCAGAIAAGAAVAGASPSPARPPLPYWADCRIDVSAPLQAYLDALGPGATWNMRPGSCYRVDEGLELGNLPGLTINGNGSTLESLNATPRPAHRPADDGAPTIDILGGANVTIENLTIVGADETDSLVAALVGQAGIHVQGTQGLTIRNVTTRNTFGDGLTIAPELAPYPYQLATGVSVSDFTVDGSGRQGITPVGLDGATFSAINVSHTAQRSIDFEADSGADAARNVTISGCTYDQGIAFSMPGSNLGPVTFDNCVSTNPGSAPDVVSSSPGPLLEYVGGSFVCHNRSPANASSCVADNGGNLLIAGTTIGFATPAPGFPTTDHVYEARNGAQLGFLWDTVSGYAVPVGTSDATSLASITGGNWSAG